jgi:hypothetical protein
MYKRKYIYLGGKRAPKWEDMVNESRGKQVSKGKAVAESKGKKVTKDKTVAKSKGKKVSKGKQVSKGKGVAFKPEVGVFLIPAKESNEYQVSADDLRDFHASPGNGSSSTNPSSSTNGGPSSSTNGGPSSQYISSKYNYKDGYIATGDKYISPGANSNASSTTNSDIYKDDSYKYLPMGENNGGYIFSEDSSSEDLYEDDSYKYPRHKTSTGTGTICPPTNTDLSNDLPTVIHIPSDDSSSEDLYEDDSYKYPRHKTSSVACEATATGNNRDVSPKNTDLNITDTLNLEGNNTDISEDNAGIDIIDAPLEGNDVSLDREENNVSLDRDENDVSLDRDEGHLDLPENDDRVMEDSNSIDYTSESSLNFDTEDDVPEYLPTTFEDWGSQNSFDYYEQAVLTQQIRDAVAIMEENYQYRRNRRLNSRLVVDTPEADSPVVANMEVEAEESVEFNTTVEVPGVEGTPTTVASQETTEVEESHTIPEVREIEESNRTVEISTQATESQTIQGDVAASEEKNSGADMNLGEENINSSEENRINVYSPVNPGLGSGESEALIWGDDDKYEQPDPDSFLDFDPCGVDVDFNSHDLHENVRQRRREAEGVVEEELAESERDAVVDLDEIIAAERERRERYNNTPTSVRQDISGEGIDVVNSPTTDNQDISGEGMDVINSPTTVNQDISGDIDMDVPNSPSVLSQDISGEEDIDLVMPMPRPNSQGEIVFECIIARSEDPEGNAMSELVASGFRESYL